MNNIALLFMFFIVIRRQTGNNSFTLPSINMAFDLDIKNTTEKIKMIKKIGPYFPEEYIPSVNKAIIITEKIVKLYEAINFIQEKNNLYITESVPVKNHKERLSYIANTIQKDFTKEEIMRLGNVADFILQMDRFNKMMNMLNYLTSNPDLLKDTDNMFKLFEPLFQGKDEKEMKKIKEMSKMLNILKAIDMPKNKEKEKENKEEKKEENL